MFASFDEEAADAQRLLSGKVVRRVGRSAKSMMLEFTDSSRLFVEHVKDGLDLSITGGQDAEE